MHIGRVDKGQSTEHHRLEPCAVSTVLRHDLQQGGPPKNVAWAHVLRIEVIALCATSATGSVKPYMTNLLMAL